jgi:hypothetical protein
MSFYYTPKRSKNSYKPGMEFDVTLIPYTGNDQWVENAILEAHQCLNSDHIPDASDNCDYCAYRDATESVILSME